MAAILLILYTAIFIIVFSILKLFWKDVFDKKLSKEERGDSLLLALVLTPVAVIGFLFVLTLVYLLIFGH